MISLIAIGLTKVVLSSDPPSSSSTSIPLCVYGAPMGTTNKGLQGEYTDGGKDSNGNDYWVMPVGTNCLNTGNTGYLYIRYSTVFKQWEISYDLAEHCYYYACNRNHPSDCGHNEWCGNECKQDFYVLIGECPPHQYEQYLDVTNYPGYWQGCNGDFMVVSGKKNLYKRIINYDYGVDGGYAMPHYWLYSIYSQKWVCKPIDPDDDIYKDYANGCYSWLEGPGFQFFFHDEPPFLGEPAYYYEDQDYDGIPYDPYYDDPYYEPF